MIGKYKLFGTHIYRLKSPTKICCMNKGSRGFRIDEFAFDFKKLENEHVIVEGLSQIQK